MEDFTGIDPDNWRRLGFVLCVSFCAEETVLVDTQIRQDVYFMSSHKTKPSLFGIPVVVPCSESSTNQDLYQAVWVQVARLVSPLPPSETAAPNHAQDWYVYHDETPIISLLPNLPNKIQCPNPPRLLYA